MSLQIAISLEPSWWAVIGAVSQVCGNVSNAHSLLSSSALAFRHYAASTYWQSCWRLSPELSGTGDRKWVSYSPQNLRPQISALSSLTPSSLRPRVCLLIPVTSRKHCHRYTVLLFRVQGRESPQDIHLTVKIIQHHQWSDLHSGFSLCQAYVLILLFPMSLRKNC